MLGDPSLRPRSRAVRARDRQSISPPAHPARARAGSVDGREAHLARGPRRAPGRALAGQLRDVAAAHVARRGGRHPVPDRRPERVRQGLARDPLPLADLADARPDRRLQRRGGVRRAAPTPASPRRAATAPRRRPAARSASSRRGSAATARLGQRQPALHVRATSSSARPTGSPTRPPCRWPSGPATPTTRSSCTAASASARRTSCTRSATPVVARFPRKRVVYATSEKFTNEFITEHPAGPDRRLPRPLPADRPPPDRRHPVHRRQGADPGGVLPHVQRDPRGRQADRPLVRPAAQADHDARGAPAQPVRVGPHRRPHGARPRDADRDPAGQGRGVGASRSART